MLQHEYLAMQLTKARQQELTKDQHKNELLNVIINEYKAQLRERRNRRTLRNR